MALAAPWQQASIEERTCGDGGAGRTGLEALPLPLLLPQTTNRQGVDGSH